MIHWKREGDTVRQGLSLYHPKDKHSIGGVLRIGNHMWRLRYSKIAKQWFKGYDKIDPKALTAWETKHGLRNE
jgi:hypothetical protein